MHKDQRGSKQKNEVRSSSMERQTQKTIASPEEKDEDTEHRSELKICEEKTEGEGKDQRGSSMGLHTEMRTDPKVTCTLQKNK